MDADITASDAGVAHNEPCAVDGGVSDAGIFSDFQQLNLIRH